MMGVLALMRVDSLPLEIHMIVQTKGLLNLLTQLMTSALK